LERYECGKRVFFFYLGRVPSYFFFYRDFL
jgi:hypothetical protein